VEAAANDLSFKKPGERPETQVTLRTGHIGDTLSLNVGSQGMGFGEGDSESQAF